MYIVNNPKIVFVDIPKTGSRSILRVLEREFPSPNGIKMKDHIMRIGSNHKDYYSFTVVRNPYARVCSLWWSTCKRGNDNYDFVAGIKQSGFDNTLEGFLGFMQKVRFGRVANAHRMKGHRLNFITTQADFINNNNFDKILYNERLDDDLGTLPFLAEDVQVPHVNVTTQKAHNNPVIRPPMSRLLTPRCVELINSLYAEDFDLLEYPKR